jgi:hypothetical protein
VEVERLALAAPTLDDVFLALTGTATSAGASGAAHAPEPVEVRA